MMNDIMIDYETTGIDPSRNAIIQLAAVRFDYETGAIDNADMFNMSLSIPGWRSWDLDTWHWWQKNKAILDEILSKAQPPRDVLMAFGRWVNSKSAEPRMWAKPSHFEFPFLQSYYRDFELPIPFGYRETIDLNSFMRGTFQDPGRRAFDQELPMIGAAHNAIYDVIHQISYAFEIRKRHAEA